VNAINSPLNKPWRGPRNVTGQPKWYIQTDVPTATTGAKIANRREAAEAGVKGVIYVWEDITIRRGN